MPHKGIVTLPDDGVAEVGIREKSGEGGDGGVVAVKKGPQCVVEDVFHPWPPAVRPDVAKGRHQGRGDERAVLRSGGRRDEVQGRCEGFICRIEVDHVVDRPVFAV